MPILSSLPFIKGDSEGFYKGNKIPPAPFRKGGEKMMFTFTVIPNLIPLSLPFVKGDLEGF
jgi:hypothetical protein